MGMLAGWGFKFRKNGKDLPLEEYEKIWVEFDRPISGATKYSPTKKLFIVVAMSDDVGYVFHYNNLTSITHYGLSFEWNGEDYKIIDFYDRKDEKKEKDLYPKKIQRKEEFEKYLPSEKVKETPQFNFLNVVILFGLLYFIFKYKK